MMLIYNLILISFIWLKLSLCNFYNLKLLKHVLQHTEAHFNFTKVTIFIGERVSIDECNRLQKYLNELPQLKAQYIYTTQANDTIWNLLRNHIQFDVMSVVLCNHANDTIWFNVDRRLRKLRKLRMIAVLPVVERTTSQVDAVIAKLWRLQFLNAIVLYNNEIYSYMPYPSISIYKVNKNSSEDYFPTMQKDLLGYNISMSLENDIPRVFFITDIDGKQHVKGFAYQIFKNFLKRMNATLHISNLEETHTITSSVNMSNILNRIGNLDIEITLHPYTTIEETKGIISYPMFKVRNCLIVPVRNEIERFMYLIRPFTWDAWLLIVVAILYVSFILLWLNPSLFQIESFKQRFSRSLLESISQIAFLPSVLRVYYPKVIYFFAYLFLAVLGFFTTSWYCNLLGSFLTTFLVGEQIDTYEQWHAAQLPVMAKGHEATMLFWFVPPTFKPKLQHLMLSVNASVFVSHLLNFNTSYAYPETEERWTFLALQQQYANKPIYRYSNLCFGQPTVGYPMRLDSHLEHFMTQFILDVQMSGLDHYWLTADFKYALKAGYVRLLDNVLPFKALDLDSLRVAWCIVIVGWLGSIIAFVVEIFHLKEINIFIR